MAADIGGEIFAALKAAASALAEKEKVSFWKMPDSAPVGVPDALYAGMGTGGVMQIKRVRGSVVGSASLRIPYRPGERSFLRIHGRDNPRTFVLIKIEILDRFYLIGPKGDYPAVYEGGSDELMGAALWSGKSFGGSFFHVLTRRWASGD